MQQKLKEQLLRLKIGFIWNLPVLNNYLLSTSDCCIRKQKLYHMSLKKVIVPDTRIQVLIWHCVLIILIDFVCINIDTR